MITRSLPKLEAGAERASCLPFYAFWPRVLSLLRSTSTQASA
jgi:hypothetical protein